MSDLFSTLIGSPVARRVGVPQPTRLRRFEPGMPLCEAPVLVAGGGRFADGVAAWLDGLGIATIRGLGPESPGSEERTRLGGVVLDHSEAHEPP